ncbi:MAG: dephospho-CoA kinase [Streptosporangiales bacterium]|nr:dephospho-CoA kinase [Streptosporangiales bacterium]MBO0890521.1 dephospho-CoA kinase [Acidothermales bacterium]
MIRVGLTGGIGSGKSEVARRLAGHGAVVVDADVVAREVVAPGTPGLADVVRAFGAEVLAPDGSLDRPRLGKLVFGDADARRRLEAIVHPLVRARRAEIVAAAPPDAVVVEDVPLLVETGLAGDYDVVVVVDAPDEVRLHRLEARGTPRDDAERRIAAQASRADRLAAADVVVDNSGSLDRLHQQVDALWAELRARAATASPPPP